MDIDDDTVDLIPEIPSNSMFIYLEGSELWCYGQVSVDEYRRALQTAFEIEREYRLVFTVFLFAFLFAGNLGGLSITIPSQIIF